MQPPAEHRFQVGNPGGPGRGHGRYTFQEKLLRLLARAIPEAQGGGDMADVVAEALVKKATKGDARFMAMLLDRAYGRAALPAEHDLALTVVDAMKAVDQAEAAMGKKSDGPIKGVI